MVQQVEHRQCDYRFRTQEFDAHGQRRYPRDTNKGQPYPGAGIETSGQLAMHPFRERGKIARAVDFPSALLKPAQQYSRHTLRHLIDEMETRYGMWSDSAAAYFSHFLKMWMIQHIVAVDMPMKPMLQAHVYNFWPGWNDIGSAAGKDSPLPATQDMGACECGCGCDSHSSTIKPPTHPSLRVIG